LPRTVDTLDHTALEIVCIPSCIAFDFFVGEDGTFCLEGDELFESSCIHDGNCLFLLGDNGEFTILAIEEFAFFGELGGSFASINKDTTGSV
jgi:hypothetical protein